MIKLALHQSAHAGTKLMKSFYIMIALLAPAPADAQDKENRQQQDREIIVTGQRLTDTKKALEACLKRNCPPDEDIDATLAHAENLFIAGEYQEARRTVKQSISRNERHARNYPVPVSDLYRVNSRVAAHLGEGGDYERSTWAIKRALKAGLPDEDVRVLASDFEIAGMQAGLNKIDSARATYDRIEKRATQIGRPDLAGIARLREAWLSQISGDTSAARAKLRKIAENRDPATKVARLSALVLLARLDRQEGKLESSDALIGELRQAGLVKPTLLYSPPVELDNLRAEAESGSTTRLMAMDNFDDKWIDVGFWVQPNGRVADVEVLRKSGGDDWAKPLLKSIEGRIYSPISEDSGGSYRVERYSYTSLWASRTGTRIRQRSQDARIEFLDLTVEPEPKQ